MVTFIDRSRVLAFQGCPRQRYLNYHFQGSGIQRNMLSIPLATGSYIHKGLEELLNGKTVDSAASTAVDLYKSAADAALGAMDVLPEHYAYTIDEQTSLVEALVRVYALRGLPALLADYEVVSIEQEFTSELAPDLMFMGRVDGLLRKRVDGETYVLSFKTDSGKSLESKVADARVDLQGHTEPWLVERAGNAPPFGILMQWLIKGQRLDNGDGRRLQDSVLIRPYRRMSVASTDFAWCYYWPCPGVEHSIVGSKYTRKCKGDVKQHGLGDSWGRVNIWELMPVKEWIEMLAQGAIQPEAGEALAEHLYNPPPIYRNAEEQRRRLVQIESQEMDILDRLDYLSPDVESPVFMEQLDANFPQHTDKCYHMFGGKCQYAETLCHVADPAKALINIAELGFTPRIPNHPQEAEGHD